MFFFEDFREGEVYTTIGRTLGEFELLTFVGMTGFFEEMFLSEEYAREKTLFGKRVIPGPLVYIIADGLYIQLGLMKNGMAYLSVTDLRIIAPTACGDTIHSEVRIEKTRATSKPGRGIVTTSHRVLNQHGTLVMTYRTERMVRAREAAPAGNAIAR